MRLVIDEDARREIREGLRLRHAELVRLRKKLEDYQLDAAVRDVDVRMELIHTLLRETASEEELAEMDGRDPRQLEIPTGDEARPVEEALEGAEAEAAAAVEGETPAEDAPAEDAEAAEAEAPADNAAPAEAEAPAAVECAHEHVELKGEDGPAICTDCGAEVHEHEAEPEPQVDDKVFIGEERKRTFRIMSVSSERVTVGPWRTSQGIRPTLGAIPRRELMRVGDGVWEAPQLYAAELEVAGVADG